MQVGRVRGERQMRDGASEGWRMRWVRGDENKSLCGFDWFRQQRKWQWNDLLPPVVALTSRVCLLNGHFHCRKINMKWKSETSFNISSARISCKYGNCWLLCSLKACFLFKREYIRLEFIISMSELSFAIPVFALLIKVYFKVFFFQILRILHT